jgi:hypothetical protein
MKGSTREIIDPLESIVKNTYAIINAADRNAIGQAVFNLGKIEGMGKYVEEIPRDKIPVILKEGDIVNVLNKLGLSEDQIQIPPELIAAFRPAFKVPGKENIISVWFDGKPKWADVHPDLYEAIAGLSKVQQNQLIRILSVPARALRMGATMFSPEFAVRNPVRDQWTAALYSKYGFLHPPGSDLVRGLFHVISNDAMYDAWRAGGGEHSMLVSLDRDSLQKTLKQVIDSGQARGIAKTIIMHPIDSLRALSEFGEEATRLGEFSRGIAQSGMTKENIIQSALNAREVTLDFARAGETVKAVGINQIVAFLNANMQGFDKMYRFAKDNPGLFMARGIATITIPSLLLYLMNQDDPRYRELPQWQKDLFWIVPSGSMDTATWQSMTPDQKTKFNQDHTIWRIPKPFEPGLLFGSLPERVLDWVYGKDPEALKKYAMNFISNLPNPFAATFAWPLIENMANYNTFLGRRIVPRSKEDVEPSHQYGTYTSESAKAIGGAIGYSPAKIENLVRGWLGGLGQYALDITGALLKKGDIPQPEKSLADRPVIRGFVARFPGQQASIERFYELNAEAKQKKATFDDLKRNRKLKEALQYRKDNIEAIRLADRLDDPAKMLSTINKRMDAIRDNPRLTPEQKRFQLESLSFRAADIARRAITRVKQPQSPFNLTPSGPPELPELPQ